MNLEGTIEAAIDDLIHLRKRVGKNLLGNVTVKWNKFCSNGSKNGNMESVKW